MAKKIPKKKLREYKELLKVYQILINFCHKVAQENPNSNIAKEHKRYMEYFQYKAMEIQEILKSSSL